MTKFDSNRAAKIGIGAIIYLAAFGIMVASQNDRLDQYGEAVALSAVLGSALAIVVITTIWAKAIGMVSDRNEQLGPSVRKSRNSLIMAGVLGGLIGLAFVLSGDLRQGGADLFSNKPIAPIAAIVLGLTYSIGCILGSVRWNRTADEHERAAATTGAYAGILTYCIFAPVWWLGERASILPQQQPMIVFALVLTVYGAVWTYKRGE